MTYRLAFSLIGKGLWNIAKMLPKTFGKNTVLLVKHHPIYLVVFVTIIVYQFGTIATQRVQRDADSLRIQKMQATIDSLECKHLSYQSYK